jgi:mycofactocin biosynthesis protein MftB
MGCVGSTSGVTTDPAAPSSMAMNATWRLHPQVSLRDESFGALAYHYGNRRLIFLKSPELVALVRSLDSFASLDEALDAAVPPGQHETYRRALERLRRSEIICVD